ncbi:TPA: hemagglutinin, partial [Neisseria meningitidis]
MGASASISGKTLGQGAQNKPQNKHLTSVADKNGASSSVGYGSDQDSQSSITKSGINTRNIHITDEAGQLARTGRTAKETEARIYTGIDTETADQH